MKNKMPLSAAFIASFREVFGDCINESIKKGMTGQPNFFHATENGNEVGTAFIETRVSVVPGYNPKDCTK